MNKLKRLRKRNALTLTIIFITDRTATNSVQFLFPSEVFNLFTTIHDGNFRRHSSMNVTIK